MTGYNLNAAKLTGANLTETNLTGTDLGYIQSGGIIGTPYALPVDWEIINGYLMGPGAYLGGADMTGFNLSDIDLDGADFQTSNLTDADFTDTNLTAVNFASANLTGATMTGANLGGALWENTTCPDGTNSGDDLGTCTNDL